MLQISTAELAADANRYISMLGSQDILITKDEEPIARLTAVKDNTSDDIEVRLAAAKALFGILPSNIDLEQARMERLSQ